MIGLKDHRRKGFQLIFELNASKQGFYDCLFCLQLNYDGLDDDDDDDDDDQFSSVYCFAIKIYKTRSSKYLKANGKEAHGKPTGL